MTKSNYFRRGRVIHMSAEAESAWRFIAAWPSDIYRLGAESLCLRSLLEHPAPRIAPEALAGAATGVDLARLMIAAIPSERIEDLEFKKLIFEDRDPLMAEAALLPLLAEASIVSDEFRLGIRTGRRKLK